MCSRRVTHGGFSYLAMLECEVEAPCAAGESHMGDSSILQC